jgi:HKD family nuclease
MGPEIECCLSWCASTYIASAFVTAEGLDSLETYLKLAKRRKTKAEVRLLFGIAQRFTPPAAVVRILNMQKAFPGAFFARVARNNRFHWKLYVFRKGKRQVSDIGSSNLTRDGMTASGQLSVKLTTRTSEKLSRAVAREFEALWSDDNESFPIDSRFARKYGNLRPPQRNIIDPRNDRQIAALLKPPTRPARMGSVKAHRARAEFVSDRVSGETRAIVRRHKNSWKTKKWDWICYQTKSSRDTISSAGSFLLLTRDTPKRYYLEFVQVMDET